MNFNWCLRVRCSIHISLILLFYCLIFIVSPNDAVGKTCNLADLRVACSIRLKESNFMPIKKIPCQCTSVIVKTSDCSDDDELNLILSGPRAIPVYLVADTFPYDEWKTFFRRKPLNLKFFTDIIDKHCLAGIFFDNFWPFEETIKPDAEINKGIEAFFKELKDYYKKKNREIILGIALPFDLHVVDIVLPLCDFDSFVDAYFWSTLYMPGDTSNVCPQLYNENDIVSMATHFRSGVFQCVSTCKIVVEVNLFVIYNDNFEMSFGEACALCTGSDVSIIPLTTMHIMGRLINFYGLAGGLLRFVNQDDQYGTCCCSVSPQYPGLHAFISGLKNEEKCWSCFSYGVPGIYQTENVNCTGCKTGTEVCQHPKKSACEITP